MSDRRPDAGITDPGYNGGGITDGPRKFKPPTPRKPKPDVDYAETLLKAIDTTVTTRIQQAHLDKTVLCTVLESDWTNVDKGEYYVSEGDAKYMAMGEANSYRTGDRVWVLIPLGDYNNQKTIISRQVGDVGDSFVYISPLENFVRLTEDLIPNTNKGVYGLKTNDTNEYNVQIASLKMTESGAVDIGGFSAFGVSAKFKTDIAGLEVMRGNYGLHLVIQSVKEEIVGTENGKQTVEHTPIVDNLYLQCSDMWGNPYGYDMFFEQSKMFEINDPGRTKIKSIDVYFFQTYDKGHDANITDEEAARNSGKFVNINQLDVAVPEENNLFIKDVSIYFGHTVDNLNTNAYLYSQNSPNFIIKDGNDVTLNDKTLVAKFIYTDNTGKHYVLNSLGNNAVYTQLTESGILPSSLKVRWYIYNPLSTQNDLRAGSGWDDITDVLSGTTNNRCVRVDKYGTYTKVTKNNTIYTDTQRTFRLNDADAAYEKFKVAFILFDSGLNGQTAPTDEDLANANSILHPTSGTSPTEEQIAAAEQVVEDYNAFQKEVRYWSQEIQFVNGDDQTWASLDVLNSLKLEFDDGGYNGNYLIYNTAASGQAKMLNSGDARVKRVLKGNFKSYITNETDLTRSSAIRWYIPKDTQTNHTMISEPDWKDVHFSGYVHDIEHNTFTNQNPALIWEPLNGKKATYNNGTWSFSNPGERPSTDIDTTKTWNNYYIFEARININKTTGLADLQNGKISIPYRIKEYWNQHFTNNTIMCKIIRDGKLYEKSVDLKFGAHGTNGTEYSLIAELRDEYWVENPNAPINEQVIRLIDKNVPAWCSGHDKNSYITLFCQLYDERNKELPAKDVQYSWTVEQFTGGLSSANIFEVATITASDGTKEYRLQIKSNRRSQNSITEDDWVGAYLKCTATYKNNEYSQYLLVPIRISEKYIGCVGTTQAIYTYANTAPSVSSKDKYQILNDDYSLGDGDHRETIAVYDSTVGLPDVQTVNNKLSVYTDLPYLSNIKRSNVPVNERARQLATLILPPMYYADVNYKMSVRMLNAQEKALWAQPILITRDVFTNSFLNQWDGSLQIDTKANRIASAAVFAGKKESNNSFTGVIMGELQGENPQKNPNAAPSYETGYGIYGRNKGNHTFGINTNGTAYLGDASYAQLMFKAGVTDGSKTNVWESTIQNAGYTSNSKTGMKLDFLGTTSRRGGTAVMDAPYIDIINPASEDNKINRITMSGNASHLLEVFVNANVAPGGSGNSKKQILHVGNDEYYLQTEGYTEGSKGTKIDLKDGSFKSFNGGASGALLISSTGYKNDDGDFKVNGKSPNGDGWVLYSHQNFGVDTTGKIFAQAGNIAGWTLNSNSLYKNNATPGANGSTLVLSSGVTSSNNIAGSGDNTEHTWMISAGTGFGVTTGGALYSNSGKIGGWNINGSNLYTGTLSGRSAGDVRISSGNFTRNIGSGNGIERTNLRLAIGGNFAVDRSGTLYASGGIFSGTISASTISGSTIKGGTITADNSIYCNSLNIGGNWVSYTSTDVVGIIKNINLYLNGSTLSAELNYQHRTLYGFGIDAGLGNNVTATGLSITLPSSSGGGGGGDDSGCILKGTPILMADYSYKNIENIKNNDMVLSYNEQTQTYEPAIVSIGATPFPSHYIYDICLENGEILSLTGSHPLLTTEGWKALNIEMAYKEHKVRTQLLHTGDEVLSINNETYRIKQIIAQPYAENYEVYNIVVPKNKTYFANNLIVHNAGNDEKIIH